MTINWEVIIWTCITLAVLMSVIGLILYAISARMCAASARSWVRYTRS